MSGYAWRWKRSRSRTAFIAAARSRRVGSDRLSRHQQRAEWDRLFEASVYISHAWSIFTRLVWHFANSMPFGLPTTGRLSEVQSRVHMIRCWSPLDLSLRNKLITCRSVPVVLRRRRAFHLRGISRTPSVIVLDAHDAPYSRHDDDRAAKNGQRRRQCGGEDELHDSSEDDLE